MNLFERITDQMLVECEDGKATWQQAWWRVVPKDATPPHRTDEEQECYEYALDIAYSYAERTSLSLSVLNACPTATYNFEHDEVRCPCRLQFDCDADFFGTLFHELVHSTGHKSRLARPGFNPSVSKGQYDQEELIAELGSLYLLGICCYNDGKVFDQSVAYIKHYKAETKTSDEDLRIIARMAEKAVDYILGDD